MRRIVFYTRGDAQWGMGHLHRVSWLAEAIQRRPAGGEETLLVRCLDSAEARNYWSERLPQLPAPLEVEYLPAPDLRLPVEGISFGDTIVADWLDNEIDQVRQALRCGARVVLQDEYGSALGEADLVINSLLAPLASEEIVIGRARVLSGVEYMQLPPVASKLRQAAEQTQRELNWQLAGPAPWSGPARAVLVSFGGLARHEAVQCTLEALAHLKFDGQVICIPGPSGLKLPPELKVTLHPAGPQFHDLLAACDLAVTGGGLTLHEAACLGVPAVVLAVKSGAPGRELHQLETARKLEQAGFGVAAGLAGKVSPWELALVLGGLIQDDQRRGQMAAQGMRLVDGRGLERTVELIAELM